MLKMPKETFFWPPYITIRNDGTLFISGIGFLFQSEKRIRIIAVEAVNSSSACSRSDEAVTVSLSCGFLSLSFSCWITSVHFKTPSHDRMFASVSVVSCTSHSGCGASLVAPHIAVVVRRWLHQPWWLWWVVDCTFHSGCGGSLVALMHLLWWLWWVIDCTCFMFSKHTSWGPQFAPAWLRWVFPLPVYLSRLLFSFSFLYSFFLLPFVCLFIQLIVHPSPSSVFVL